MVCRGPALDVAALCANGVFPATGWAPLALRWRRAGIDNRKDGRPRVQYLHHATLRCSAQFSASELYVICTTNQAA
eukprot:scaffold741_cov79-Phaeocystis_antarctica.AAC.3